MLSILTNTFSPMSAKIFITAYVNPFPILYSNHAVIIDTTCPFPFINGSLQLPITHCSLLHLTYRIYLPSKNYFRIPKTLCIDSIHLYFTSQNLSSIFLPTHLIWPINTNYHTFQCSFQPYIIFVSRFFYR